MERLRIREAVESGRYEETLKVAFHAPRAEIHQAHIRALAKHRNCTVTRELINHAKKHLGAILEAQPPESVVDAITNRPLQCPLE